MNNLASPYGSPNLKYLGQLNLKWLVLETHTFVVFQEFILQFSISII